MIIQRHLVAGHQMSLYIIAHKNSYEDPLDSLIVSSGLYAGLDVITETTTLLVITEAKIFVKAF